MISKTKFIIVQNSIAMKMHFYLYGSGKFRQLLDQMVPDLGHPIFF
jgi:hypothetical protein